MACYDILSIAAAEVYETTWWSPTHYHIRTGMIHMNYLDMEYMYEC